MSKPAIKVEGLWKQYTVGAAEVRRTTFYDTIVDGVKAPFRRLRNLRGGTPEENRFWALQDVGFEVAPGEVLGILGRNGAGKSTLLKVLSRITAPTRGKVTVNGRMASLLEVGTGFHPELSGRENIFLNGAILGMRRAEILRKFDEIVEFAEVGKFIDTPVKRYSSGMYVRLAFSVAAHLDVDVLVVDEVLAVGDVEFQRKCMGKMGSVSSSGRTVLFVSHNLGAVEQLCQTALILDKGELLFRGSTAATLERFHAMIDKRSDGAVQASFNGNLSDRVIFERVSISQPGKGESRILSPREPITITVTGRCQEDLRDMDITLGIYHEGVRLLSCHDAPPATALAAGAFQSTFHLPASQLRPGRFSVAIGGRRVGRGDWLWATDVESFDIAPEWDDAMQARDLGVVSLPYTAHRTAL